MKTPKHRFFSSGKYKKKRQIILINTGRNSTDYVSSLKFRYNGRYNKIPHYLITREGTQHKFLENDDFSAVFSQNQINKQSIIIALENLGWLEKIPLSDKYVNWIDDIYIGEVFERKWRDYFYWQPYPNEQIDSCLELCTKLTNSLSIERKFIGHNTKVNGVEKFNGIVCRSNYDAKYTDLNPAFDFENFLKKMEYEQQL